MRTISTTLLALVALLAACDPVASRELHEVVLVEPAGSTKVRYVYGDADRMVLNAPVRELGGVVGDAAEGVPYAVSSARTVDGAPYLATGIDRAFGAPLTVRRIPLSSDLRLVTHAPLERALYFDGERWLSLGRDLESGRTTTVVPAPVSGRLRGVGSLTPAEADAIARTIAEAGRPTVVAVLPEGRVAAITGAPALAASPPDGLEEYRHTALWIQRDIRTDASAYTPPAEGRIHDVVGRGEQGDDPGEDRFVRIADADELRAFWNAVHGGSFSPPPVPDADFDRETLLGVRLSERSTGGYGIDIDSVAREGDELYVDVRLTEPAEDAVTTQALTTPWVLVRVLGVDADVAWFRDADSGELIAVARDEEGGGF